MWSTFMHKWLQVPYTLHVHTDQHVRKPRATILFIHGIGSSGAAWDEIITKLPNDLRLVTVDLLGFGQSQRPPWVVYSAKTQARSVAVTFLKLRITGRVIVVGHSLGALVAVEIARRYPLLVRSLVLCSPPFYKVNSLKRKLIPTSDEMLKELYRLASHHPNDFVKMSNIAARFGLVNQAFSLNGDNEMAYMNALEATIINQTSLEDAKHLKVPMQILYGRLDPVVVLRNLRYLVKGNQHATLSLVLAGHEVQGPLFVKATLAAINKAIGSNKKYPFHKTKRMI